MKLTKYTFRTPLFGSISCEEALSDPDRRIELSPRQMCDMYNNGPELMSFLSENAEDLADCVPEELDSLIIRAEFGDFAILEGKMWLRTYIWVDGDLTPSGIDSVQDWIAGQMSDGWGEGLEQTEWKAERIRKPVLYFDEGSCKFEEDYELCDVFYYVHPWNSDDFEIYLENHEDVEEDVTYEVVATMQLPYHKRQVVKLRQGIALTMFLKEFVREPEFARDVKDSLMMPDSLVFMVKDLEGNSGVEVLPKWVSINNASCVYHEITVQAGVVTVQMCVRDAVLELLK